MQKQPSRGTLMKRAPKNTTKSTGEHPRRSETPKKLALPPPTPYPLGGEKKPLHKSTPKELHLRLFKNPN